MADAAQLNALIEPVVRSLGLEPVRVLLGGGVLQVMAEDASGQLTIEQCATISRALSEVLDEADPIEHEYRLEVSSPGIDRPLTRAKDWTDWTGHEAKVTLAKPMDGQKRFTGEILALEGDTVVLAAREGGEVRVPLAAIETAKLSLTDKLIEATRPLSTEGAEEFEEEDV